MARINCEHLRGFSPEKPFFSYGNVQAVKTEEIDIDIAGKTERRLALFAQIEPNAELQRITGAGQKIFTSIEVNPNFAGTGKAYLAGIAATDSPASLGTEVLAFASKASNNLYTAADEAGAIEIEADPADVASPGLLDAFRNLVKAAIGGDAPKPETPPSPPAKPETPPANDNSVQLSAIAQALQALPETLAKMSADAAAATQKVAADLAALTAKLDATEAPGGTRPPVTGNGDYQRADC